MYQGKDIIGFRILDFETTKCMDIPYNNAMQVIQSKQANIIGLEIERGKIVGSNGKLERYPKIVAGELNGNNHIIILKQVGDEGYTVSDWQGNIRSYRNKDLITLVEDRGMQISNGKVVSKEDGTKFISAIAGSYEMATREVRQGTKKVEPKEVPKEPKEPKELVDKDNDKKIIASPKEDKSIPKNVKLKESKAIMPKIVGNPLNKSSSKLKEIDSKYGMTLEQKMAKSMLSIKAIRSFYYAILSSVKRIESNEVETMGVSVDTLYFNPDFTLGLTLPELVFVELHEVCHLAMRHNQRKGHRENLMWNVACDLYVNKLICEEFGIAPGSGVIYPSEDTIGCGIQFMDGGLYVGTVDINKETPESIYDELMKERENINKEKGQSGEGDGKGEGQSGEGESSGGQSGGKSNGQSGGKESTQPKEGQGGDGGAGESTDKDAEYTFRGQNAGKLKVKDIVDDESSSKKTAEQKENETKRLMNRAVVLQKQSTGSFGGETGSWMERYVEDMLAPKINWRSLVKNKLTLANQKINTFSAPDKRFVSRNRILPGPRALENNALDNVKVCIDTSGSISDKDLGIAMAQIKQLLKVYKASAELIYWDTQVRECKPFNNVDELLKIRPKGGGGTDVNCVFAEFEGRDYRIGKKQKPSIIIIFTDGCFSPPDNKYKKYKDTIWVLHGNYDFKAPFGTVAPFKHEVR